MKIHQQQQPMDSSTETTPTFYQQMPTSSTSSTDISITEITTAASTTEDLSTETVTVEFLQPMPFLLVHRDIFIN